jgi:Ni,Fe-hydrogenase I large subunit
LLGGYIKGELQEGALIQGMKEFNITPDEFDQAAIARDRMRQLNVPMQQAQAPLAGQPPVAQQQPQESFRFKKPVDEQRLAIDQEKFAMEKQDREETRSNKSQAVIDSSDKLIETVDHLIKNKNYFGPIEGSIPPMFPGKIEFDENYKYLQANNVMKVLAEMKSQSRTGATGFGALNEKELALIQDAASKLNVRMDEKTAEKYLMQMKESFQKIKDREQNGYPGEVGGQTAMQAQPKTSGQIKVGRFLVEEM